MLATSRPTPTRSFHADLVAPPLSAGAKVDVCLVGAGMASMTAAYLLAREKRSVMVLDEGPIGDGEVGAEVSHLASMLEHPYWMLEKLHGARAARTSASGHQAAIEGIEATVKRERIACEFERLDGYCFSPGEAMRATAEREVEAARRAGVAQAELCLRAPIECGDPGPCVHYPAQVQLNPIKYLAGLARAITRSGGRIHCGVRTQQIEASRPSAVLTSSGHRIEADVIVVPGGARPPAPVANVVGLRVPRGSVSRALYWEANGQLRCARLGSGTAAGETLLVAGTEEPDALVAWARRRFPCAGEIVLRTSGGLPRTADLHAFVGHREGDSDSLYVSTASWGSALSRAAVAGMLIRDFVLGRPRD